MYCSQQQRQQQQYLCLFPKFPLCADRRARGHQDIQWSTLQEGKPKLWKPHSFIMGISLPAFAWEGDEISTAPGQHPRDISISLLTVHLCKGRPEQGHPVLHSQDGQKYTWEIFSQHRNTVEFPPYTEILRRFVFSTVTGDKASSSR